MAARLLIVEDDPSTLTLLRDALAADGYAVEALADGALALARASEVRFDLILSDVNLPGLDGFSLCRRLRAKDSRAPIILLTSRDSEIDEALGLELGADDYVTKPFSLRVLRARIAGLLRRSSSDGASSERDELFERGPLRIDRARLRVQWHDALLETTVTELRLIEALATRAGRVLSREKLLELAREDDSVVAPRIVDTYVARVRKKFDAVRKGSDPIETVVGAGYRYRDDR
ncbi:MAG: response regulator transcription factor [Polyangiales bacterium]